MARLQTLHIETLPLADAPDRPDGCALQAKEVKTRVESGWIEVTVGRFTCSKCDLGSCASLWDAELSVSNYIGSPTDNKQVITQPLPDVLNYLRDSLSTALPCQQNLAAGPDFTKA